MLRAEAIFSPGKEIFCGNALCIVKKIDEA